MGKRILVSLLSAVAVANLGASVFAMNPTEEMNPVNEIKTRLIERPCEEQELILVHVATERQWNESLNKKFYGDFSIKKDGFIHCSSINDIVEVANGNLKKIKEPLMLLCIDTDILVSKIVLENRGDKDKKFPHIYGLINTDSVIKTFKFEKDCDGNFYVSDEIKNFIKVQSI